MISLVNQTLHRYDQLWQFKDDRVDRWPGMASAWPTLAACLTYFLVVKRWGPRYMQHRPAYQLRTPIIAYNLMQVCFSSWLFKEFALAGWLTGEYSWICQPVLTADDDATLRMAAVAWWFYISKFTEFLDTIFFVLRKKDKQISTLHVIHHGIMPFSVWLMVRFVPTGHGTFTGLLNSFVHIVMYFYYLLAAALGPKYQHYLWWKKYITTIQLVQFVMAGYHSFQLYLVDCDYPRLFIWWVGLQQTMFLGLFCDFYRKTYNQRREPAKDQ